MGKHIFPPFPLFEYAEIVSSKLSNGLMKLGAGALRLPAHTIWLSYLQRQYDIMPIILV